MIDFIQKFRRRVGATGPQAHSRRRGSVLILVVALLVLIALVGTAWIVSTRVDRAASAQNVAGTKSDLLLEGAVRMAQAVIIDGDSGYAPTQGSPFVFKPTDVEELPTLPAPALPPTLPQLAGGKPFDHAYQNWWMADRIPVQYFPTKSIDKSIFGWHSITWPLTVNPIAPGGSVPYSTARWAAGAFDSPDSNFPSLTLNKPRSWYFYEPFNKPFAGKPDWPFLRIYTRADDKEGAQDAPPTVAVEMPAADADGDGIADSGLWKLPIGQINGLTWFVGMRIIDNSSAFNASVNWKPNAEYINYDNAEPNRGLAGDFFPTNIDLESELFGTTTVLRVNQMAFLNAYRFNDPNFTIAGGTFGPYVATYPTDESTGMTQRPDWAFNSPYDEMWQQLGRRLGNPGYYDTGTADTKRSGKPQYQKFQALPDTDGTSLAYGFILRNPNVDPEANIEYMLRDSLSLAAQHRQPYDLTRDGTGYVKQWFSDNFDYANLNNPAADFHNRRAVMVTRSPVSNMAASHDSAGQADQQWLRYAIGVDPNSQMPAFSRGSVLLKAPINTAAFGELWRAFFMVMDYEDPNQLARLPGFPTGSETKMFRSAVRDPDGANALPPQAQLQVRAALAAVNAIDLRDGDDDVTSRRIQVPTSGDPNGPALDVTVYGTERQPFITEVFVSNDNSMPQTPPPPPTPQVANPKGYVAIELFNPYSKRIDLKNWNIVLVDRRSGQPRKTLQLTNFAGFDASNAPNIPPGGYLILHNYYDAVADMDHITFDPAGADQFAAKRVPDSAYGNQPVNPVLGARAYYIRNLHEVLRDDAAPDMHPGYEFTLVRPRRADGTLTTGTDYDEIAGGVRELLAVDSFDFSIPDPQNPGGFRLVGGSDFSVFHYNRVSGAGALNFRCVYPGRYYANATSNPARPAGYQFRHEGVESDTWNPNTPANKFDPWDYRVPRMIPPDPPVRPPLTPVALGLADPASSYLNNTFKAIQLNNEDFGGPNKPLEPLGAAKNRFPFGGFARLGDILQVPYIGGFRIKASKAAVTTDYLEASPVTMDCAFADDLDASDDAVEQIGRFCPLRAVDPTFGGVDNYSWARDLFDYFTVFAPADDYSPNVSPLNYTYYNAGSKTYIAPGTPERTPSAAGRDVTSANQANELYVPVEARININTAPIPVLAGLPFTNSRATNIQIATNIVQYRDGVPENKVEPAGPFKSLFDLQKVPGFQKANGTINLGADQTDDDGDLSPAGNRNDGILDDFEPKFLALNRISNLVTLRSDSFTCYITLQGWSQAGTGNPRMMIERRTAFIGDRSAVTPIIRDFTPSPIPTK